LICKLLNIYRPPFCESVLAVSAPDVPPPPTYVPRRVRPSAVTKYAIASFVSGVFCIIIGVLGIVFCYQPIGFVTGPICILIEAIPIIVGFGLLAGRFWALKWSGWANRSWAQVPDVREYFGFPPVYPAYASSPSAAPPPPPSCSHCGQPLTYVQQYQRWYWQNCKTYE
jgi:hypothetical protein